MNKRSRQYCSGCCGPTSLSSDQCQMILCRCHAKFESSNECLKAVCLLLLKQCLSMTKLLWAVCK